MTDSHRWFLLALVVLTSVLLYLLAPVLTPFLVGATLAYIGDPLADRLEARGLSRTLSVVAVFTALTLFTLVLLVILVPMLERQIVLLAQKLPGYIDWLQQTVLPRISAAVGIDGTAYDLGALKEYIREHWQMAGGFAAGMMGSVTRSGLTVMGWMANLLLIPVVAFYLMRDWDLLMGRIRELLPRRWEPDVVRLARSSDEVLGAFLRGQLLVMFVLGAIYSIGLWLVGLELALLIGMLAGIVSFVPYLGFIVGIIAAGIAAVMQFQDAAYLLGVIAVFGVGQLVEGLILQPILLGERIGLHPVAVIFAVLAGGQLFGLMGVLLALPVAAVLAVLVRYTHERYLKSALYGAPDG